MSRCISRFAELAALVLLLGCLLPSSTARAQACCAGIAALTPGRLLPHEDVLLGAQLKAGLVLGSFDSQARFVAAPGHDRELDFEQDLFGALRVVEHGQLALLLPLVETHRRDRDGSESSAGLGDMQLSGRYDFFAAGRSRYLPGIALLAGVTLPTGRAVDASSKRLATDATGLGVFQGNVGVAFEQVYGRWLLGINALVAMRTARSIQGIESTLAPQWTGIALLGYSFESSASVGLSLIYSAEGLASIDGADAPGSARRHSQVSLSGMLPLDAGLRLQGSTFWDPSISTLGKNQNQNTGITLSVIRAW